MIDGKSNNLIDTLKEIDAEISINQSAIKLGADLEALKKDPKFISVIVNGYIDTESKKLFKILTDPSGASPYSQEKILLKLEAISDFIGYIGNEEFLGTVLTDAKIAPDAIAREREYRKEVTAEYAVEG